MGKLWEGKTDGKINEAAESFNASISFDSRFYRQDIKGSMAHASMLGAQGIISQNEADRIIDALAAMLDEIDSGKLEIDMGCEDIHSFVEQELTRRLGDLGKKLHTARSRNDQVALDMRMYLRDETDEISKLLSELIEKIVSRAEEQKATIMSGYTHLQRAQPITFGHYLLAYAMMFLRDTERLADVRRRINVSPIGACALAGTTYDTDRVYEAQKLDFDGICVNSIDAVSDRDFCIEFLSAVSLIMMHLSRFSEELILYSSREFAYIELSDDYTTGSSIMPQKKNPDMAELTRGKTGRVYGDLISLLVTMKGIPLAYNKDMQEDKEVTFDACDTVKACIGIFTGMIADMKVKKENLLKNARSGCINATDIADYLTKKGVPFRDAYKTVGRIVADLSNAGRDFEDTDISELKKYSEVFEKDVYTEASLENCVKKRISEGGTSVKSVEKQIEYIRKNLKI